MFITFVFLLIFAVTAFAIGGAFNVLESRDRKELRRMLERASPAPERVAAVHVVRPQQSLDALGLPVRRAMIASARRLPWSFWLRSEGEGIATLAAD